MEVLCTRPRKELWFCLNLMEHASTAGGSQLAIVRRTAIAFGKIYACTTLSAYLTMVG